jgi:hypothetical protein
MVKHTDAADPRQDDSTPLLKQVPKGTVMHADRLAPSWPAVTVLHSDGHWHPATLLAWCRYRAGWAAFIRWPDGTEDWRKHDPAHLRPPAAHPGSPSPSRRLVTGSTTSPFPVSTVDTITPPQNSSTHHADIADCLEKRQIDPIRTLCSTILSRHSKTATCLGAHTPD